MRPQGLPFAAASVESPTGTRRLLLTTLLGAVLLGGLAVVNDVAFRALFDSDYVRWYLRNGALIAIVFGFITLAWGDLNKETRLVSAHPLQFLAGCVVLGSLPSLALGASFRTNRSAGLIPGKSAEDEESSPHGLGIVDLLLTPLFCLAFLVAFALWLIVVAPLQYVVTLAAGAPARMALASPMRAWSRITAKGIAMGEDLKSDDLPEGAAESGFSAKPVTFSTAVGAALLFVVSQFVG